MTILDRDLIVRRIETDLIGPLETDESLTDAKPSDVYLTGILWPRQARLDAGEDDRLDSVGTGSGTEDDTQGAGEEVPLSGLQRPCAAGLSFAMLPVSNPAVNIQLRFALYQLVEHREPAEQVVGDSAAAASAGEVALPQQPTSSTGGNSRRSGATVRRWQRMPFAVNFNDQRVPVAGGVSERLAVACDGLPSGVSLYLRSANSVDLRLVTVTVINEMEPGDDDSTSVERRTMFQVSLVIEPTGDSRLVPKPDARYADDAEDRVAALLYRDCRAFAVGHTCSAAWETTADGTSASRVFTSWCPRVEVPRMQARGHRVFDALRTSAEYRPLEAAWLGHAGAVDLKNGLLQLVDAYSQWIDIEAQRLVTLPSVHRRAGSENLEACRRAHDRMKRGAERIAGDVTMRMSFQLANRAMQLQHEWNPDRTGTEPLTWRPFQLGFALLSAVSVCDSSDDERGLMDLLWFPTGGGKTEAYLLLVAMLAFHRRLSTSDPDSRAGVAAVMRYTLRLLTTQQFVRASALVLACEVIRRDPLRSSDCRSKLGAKPFSIGLWLGGEATPNRFEEAAAALAGKRDEASPEQLNECPCCHQKLQWRASPAQQRVEVRCSAPACELGRQGAEPLPVWTVDTDVYRERPTLLIGTIDKFAQLPRRPQVRELFGMGTDDTPDLVIQDELHLISGPLGTVAATYETAFDWLTARTGRRAKVVGSTATIRRATDQTRSLFNRPSMQFPPSGLDHDNSGFAVAEASAPGRLYVGVTTAGRSAKFVLQAVSGCLLQSAAGEIGDPARRDPYATLVAYFNSLRELGGALVLMQDDVGDAITLYGKRHAETSRNVDNVEELTSRRTQDEVRGMLDKLAVRATDDGCVDVVLATSMVSVGVDIPRLGLMLVNGQPKTRSEYIQATSRVGRDRSPGLVIVLLNNAKPRDRAHYETFPIWHQTLYRDVEATSVTPFAPRARDRAMHAALAAMVRYSVHGMEDSPRLSEAQLEAAGPAIDEIVARAASVDPSETRVRRELERRMNEWEARQPKTYWNDFQPNQSLLQSAERAAAQRTLGRGIGDAWPTMNNMRSVEPAVRFRLAERLRASNIDAADGEDEV